MDSSIEQCPCDSLLMYDSCCKKAHDNILNVQTAKDLMRSRYSAFTKADINYLMLSHHPDTRPLKQKDEIERWAKSVRWERLEILQFTKGEVHDVIGTVEFRAHFIEKGKKNFIHEKSLFKKEAGVWLYYGIV